jgi:hypothetical protein
MLVASPANMASPIVLTSKQTYPHVVLSTRASDNNGTFDYAEWVERLLEDVRPQVQLLRGGEGGAPAQAPVVFQAVMTDGCKPLRAAFCRALIRQS